MSYEQDHINALLLISSSLKDLLAQMRRAEVARIQRHNQLLATLRTLEPKEAHDLRR